MKATDKSESGVSGAAGEGRGMTAWERESGLKGGCTGEEPVV